MAAAERTWAEAARHCLPQLVGLSEVLASPRATSVQSILIPRCLTNCVHLV